MKVVSVINYKGGVGKTTLTANLGAYAASAGRRVLMIDLDPQTNLTFSFITPEVWKERYAKNKTFKNYFDSVIKDDVLSLRKFIISLTNWEALKLGNEKFDLISSHLELIDIDTKLASKIVVGFDDVKAATSLKAVSYLQCSLAELQNEYDIALIDCSPTFGITVKNAIFASDYYIVPARLDYLSMLGVDRLQYNVEKFMQECRKNIETLGDSKYSLPNLELLGIVPMMVNILKGDEPVAAQREYMDAMEGKGYHLFRCVRNNGSVFGGSPEESNGLPVVLTHPRFNLTAKRIVKELKELGEEFLRKVEA